MSSKRTFTGSYLAAASLRLSIDIPNWTFESCPSSRLGRPWWASTPTLRNLSQPRRGFGAPERRRLHRRHRIRTIVGGEVAAGAVIAAEADAAEGEGAAAAGGLAVPIDYAGADLFIKVGPQPCIVAQQAGHQSELRAIGLGDRL